MKVGDSEQNALPENGRRRRLGLIGAGGQLGRALVEFAARRPDLELVFATTRRELELGEPGSIEAFFRSGAADGLDVLINTAAMTRVDACETDTELAYRVNALGPAELARVCRARQVRLLHLSTDYVFSGSARRPYREEDASEPGCVYGSSKRAGELGVLGSHDDALVVRTSWLFGPGRNFVGNVLAQARARRDGHESRPLRVVEDQRGRPTSAYDLADVLLRIVRAEQGALREECGLLHWANEGSASWLEFARAILDRAGFEDQPIDPISSASLASPACRPAYSVLDTGRAVALGLAPRPWSEALQSYLSRTEAPGRTQSAPAGQAPVCGVAS